MSWTQLWSLSRDPCTLKPNKRIKSSFEPGFRTNKKNNLQLQRAGSSAGAHHCYSSLPVNRSFNCLRYPRWLQLLQPVCSFGLFIDIKLDDICFTTINQTMGMLINNEKQSLMESPLCEHRHTLFLTFKIHTRCCVGMCECVCARHFKAATWPHLISNFEQLGVWLYGGTTNSRTHTENGKHLNRNHRGEVTTHLQVPGGPEAAAAAAPSPRTSWQRTEGWWRLSTVHTQTHTHTQTGQIWKPSEHKHTKDVSTVTKSRLLFIWGVGGVGGSSSCSAPCSTTGKSSHQQQFVRAPLSVWASRVTRGKNQTRSQVSASLFNYLCSVAHPQVSLLTLRAPHNVRANGIPVFEAQLVGDDGNSAGNGRSLWELVMTAQLESQLKWKCCIHESTRNTELTLSSWATWV